MASCDDRALALFLHLRDRCACPQPGAADICAKHCVPICRGGRHHCAAAGKSGRRHQHIQLAAPRDDFADHALRKITIADVAYMHRCTVGIRQCCQRLLQSGLVAIHQRDERAFFRKQRGARLPDAGASAGNDCRTSLKSHLIVLRYAVLTSRSDLRLSRRSQISRAIRIPGPAGLPRVVHGRCRRADRSLRFHPLSPSGK